MKRPLLILLCSLLWASAQESTPSVERLAELLLGEGEAVVFSPGQLPDDLSLPLPDAARVLGSATIGEDRFIAALEVQGEQDASLERLGEAFSAAGWQGYDPFGGPSVFQTSSSRSPLTDFCTPDGRSAVYLEADALAEGTTLVLVSDTFCDKNEDMDLPLPSLTLPYGVISYGGGMSQSNTSFQANADYGTRLSAAELFEHFAAQLRAQGLARQGNLTARKFGWTSADEASEQADAKQAELTLEAQGARWQGLLTVTGAQTVLQVSRLP